MKTRIEDQPPRYPLPACLFQAAVLLNWFSGFCLAEGVVSPATLYQFREAGMGTRFTIQVYAGSEEKVRPAIAAAWKRLEELNARFSDYLPDSELMRLCRQPPGSRVPLSPELFEVLSLSQFLAHSTQGAFDISIGPLKRLWKHSCRDARLPSPAQLQEAASRTGYQKLQLHPDGTASLAMEGMRLDLGGIAKGYAARELLRLLIDSGFPSALVAASGDIAVGEAPPGRSGWTIGILTKERARELPPHSAISTSGDSEQFIEIDGVRYSHILDPGTGLGLTHQTVVSVQGPDPVMTDALATAVSVLGSAERLTEEIRREYRFLLLPQSADKE